MNFKHHVFFCLNKHINGRDCCHQHNALALSEYAKNRVKELSLSGPGNIRINKAGCLDRCADSPVMVIYPEGVWYTFVDSEDIDEIIQSHLIEGRLVRRLQLV